jgi:hypothetical protein
MEKEFNAKESLQLIEAMIEKAKFRPSKAYGYITMMWGYLVMLCALGHWVLERSFKLEYAPAVWLLMIIGFVATFIMAGRARKQKRVRSYIDEMVRQVWVAFSIAFLVLFFAIGGQSDTFLPTVLLLYGVSMWAQGALIRFKPYQMGAAVFWIAAAAAFILEPGLQLLIMAIAVVLGYILPGHLMYAKTGESDV